MTVIQYAVPLVYQAEDNKSEITKTVVIVKSCSGFNSSQETCDGWNFNHCPNDNKYCQPFIQGDIIYNQLLFDKSKYTVSSVQYINQETGIDFYNAASTTIQGGGDELNNYYGNIVTNTSHASFNGIKCWYVKVTFSPIQGGDPIYYTSEPYCLVQCNQDTVLIQGSYPNGHDCFGGYYGLMFPASGGAGVANIYKPSFRIPAVIEPDGFDFEKTTNNNKVIKSKQTEGFIFATKKIPYYVAKQIAVCFNSKQCDVDEVTYSGTIKLNKNFEEGTMWIIRETIFIECDEINFTCE
jgi:hypothetical protein